MSESFQNNLISITCYAHSSIHLIKSLFACSCFKMSCLIFMHTASRSVAYVISEHQYSSKRLVYFVCFSFSELNRRFPYPTLFAACIPKIIYCTFATHSVISKCECTTDPIRNYQNKKNVQL